MSVTEGDGGRFPAKDAVSFEDSFFLRHFFYGGDSVFVEEGGEDDVGALSVEGCHADGVDCEVVGCDVDG